METVVEFAKETVVGRPAQPLQRGKGGYTDWVMIAILCYHEREAEAFRSVVDNLKVMKEIRDLLGLSLSNLPHPSTVCRALERFSMSLFRQLLSNKLALFELGIVTAIDASGFDRIAASRRYEKRTGYRFLAM